MTDKQIITKSQMIMRIAELSANLIAKEQECEELRDVMHKDFCTHYVLGECSQEHHNNCVGRNQCIKDLEQENKELKVYKSITPLKTKMLVKALSEIKQLLEDALNTDKTSTEQSFDNIHKAIKLCEVINE